MISDKAKRWIPERFGRIVEYGEWRDPGEHISTEVYLDRLARAKRKIAESELDALIVYGDCYRMSNIRWLVDYRTIDGIYPQPMLMYLRADADPVFFLPMSEIPSAHMGSKIDHMGGDLREIRADWAPFLQEVSGKSDKQGHSGKNTRVGICGYRFMDVEFYPAIVKAFGEENIVPSTIIEQLKSVKTEAELSSMRRAARVCNAGIEMLCDLLRDSEGITEKEATSLVYAAMFAAGGHGIAFDIMIQSGENLNVLFKRPSDRVIRRGDMVMMDYGIRVNDYASDNARTICYGNVTPEQKFLMEACSRVYEDGLQSIKAGMTGIDADRWLREAFRKEGVEEYLVAPSEGRTGAHATGMDPEEEIPEIGNKVTNVLEENQTFAYELSLIRPGVGGVRTEDQVIVRKDGLEPFHTFPRFLYIE